MNETESMPMIASELSSRMDLKPITIAVLNPQPPKIIIPGLRLKRNLIPARLVEASFNELPGQPRQIPPEADRVTIRPSSQQRTSSAYFEGSNVFILPAIGGEGPRMIAGLAREFVDGRDLEILNCTTRRHAIKSPSGGLVNGVGGVIELDGIGANAMLRAVDGVWVIVKAHKAELK
jgi:hypothetical protein